MASIIKASGPIRSSDGMSFNFDDMSVQANSYLDQVHKQAAEIIIQAQQQAVAIARKAEEDGRQAAMRAVERVMDEKVGKHMATLLPALKKVTQEIEDAKQAWLKHWERTAIQVSSAIAARVIRREIAKTPDITLKLVREALELAAGSPEIRVSLNPADHAALGTQAAQLAKEISRTGTATVVGDASVTSGGCRVDTRFGTIDQQIESQLARIEEELS